MSETTEKLKSYLNTKVIIIALFVAGICIYLFLQSDTTEITANNAGGTVLVKNEKPRSRDYFEATKEQNQLASKGILNNKQPTNSGTTSISEITDDPDAAALYETQERIRNSRLAQQQQTEYVSRQRPKQQAEQITALQQALQEQPSVVENTPIERKEETEEPKKEKGNRFYEGKLMERKGNTFACVVHGEQEVMNGSTLKLRLMDEYTTGETVLPKGTTLWGVCSLTKERMNVTIQSVLKGKELIPLNFIVYDIDGLQGLNLPNNVKAEIAKRAKAEALRDSRAEDVIGNQGVLEKGASTVVNTTKNILSRKQEEIKITVKSNYRLVLKPI